ncbi:hypothetical protein ACCQ05_12395 [Xanthomonas sp. NCPPB 3582]|uniref:hypothetical protein n=1 Tax=Xanthomonas sp. NCPPB 3582 TaxID=487557 RepID=UPI0035563489
MTSPNPQLEAALAHFVAQPGTTLAQEAQLRAAVLADAARLNQQAASGQLKGFALEVPGGSPNLTGSYDKATGVVTIPAASFQPSGSAASSDLKAVIGLQGMSVDFAYRTWQDPAGQTHTVDQDMVSNLQATLNGSPVLAAQIKQAVGQGHVQHISLLGNSMAAGATYDGNTVQQDGTPRGINRPSLGLQAASDQLNYAALDMPVSAPGLISRHAGYGKLTRSTARWLALSCALALSACASAAERRPPAKETTTMQPVATTENPTLSAGEIGKRFLKLIEGLESRNDLSLNLVRESMGLKFSAIPGDESHYVAEASLGSNWSYIVGYLEETKSNQKSVYLDFRNSVARFANMTQICEIDFNYYHNALKAMEFVDHPTYGEIGQLEDWRYTKFKKSDGTVDMTLLIIPQDLIVGDSDRLCVRSIRMLNGR